MRVRGWKYRVFRAARARGKIVARKIAGNRNDVGLKPDLQRTTSVVGAL
jgi:hypothetical protein